MIDLSLLPPPDVVETLDFETVLAERTAKLRELYPDISDALERESSPVLALLQESAYRELLQRQRINESARAVMLASATGADLDQLAANLGVVRLVIDAGDASAVPPVAPTLESDAELRERCLLSLEALNTAGSRGSYLYHARSVSGDVLDANAVSPLPGHVTVYVLSRTGAGAASEPLLAAVAAALSAEDVRPLTDNVTVLSASIVEYAITATLTIEQGPDAETVRSTAAAAAQAYVDELHRLGRSVGLAGIYAALKCAGVVDVDLIAPAARVAISAGQAAYCTGITLTVEVEGG